MKRPRFQVYEAADGWRWRLLAANNRLIAESGILPSQIGLVSLSTTLATNALVEGQGGSGCPLPTNETVRVYVDGVEVAHEDVESTG